MKAMPKDVIAIYVKIGRLQRSVQKHKIAKQHRQGDMNERLQAWKTVQCNYALVNLSPPELNYLGRHFADDILEMHFREWKVWSFDKNFTQVCSWSSNWQWPNIGLDNGLAPNRRQAIIWTNADPNHWHMYASLWGDDLSRRWNNFMNESLHSTKDECNYLSM